MSEILLRTEPSENEMRYSQRCTIRLKRLSETLASMTDYGERLHFLHRSDEIKGWESVPPSLLTFLEGRSPEENYVVRALFVIEQGPSLFRAEEGSEDLSSRYPALLENLLATERFYRAIGGIVGYQHLALSLCADRYAKHPSDLPVLKPPRCIDLSDTDAKQVLPLILEGIARQDTMAEFYALGGAADRLRFGDAETGRFLPVACLSLRGRCLLEGMVADLQAREYLHYKLFRGQVVTPLVLMTSRVRDNHDHIEAICKANRWFGRPKDSFRFLIQPSVPLFDRHGRWCSDKHHTPIVRPGGHGVLWKLASEAGIFDRLISLGKKKILVRQANNPMAGIDSGLLAFAGVGHRFDKAFGFVACESKEGVREGKIALKESVRGAEKRVSLTNIEYTEAEKYGVSLDSFPSNVNVLFADIRAVARATPDMPLPGLLVNFREGDEYVRSDPLQKVAMARPEATMQNIADAFTLSMHGEREVDQDALASYVTFHQRRKIISTTKCSGEKGKFLPETPETCLRDFLRNGEELLRDYCRMTLTTGRGLPFVFHYHPALGPVYSIIGQKIRRGEMTGGSQMHLTIADLDMEGVVVDGALMIFADRVVGHFDAVGHLVYSDRVGQCVLKNVRVKNEGHVNDERTLFSMEGEGKEGGWGKGIGLTIRLKGHSRFEAANVTFCDDRLIEVPDGIHMIAEQEGDEIRFVKRSLPSGAKMWSYSTDEDAAIRLVRRS
ncbi:MAG: UTP--glucose-1-phosphate uridylyltransferase [Simkaniaceae bacterium]|nr:UTP--glucose-1-phosphate uridylyltransferase [Simkaniaceae bacterium]